VLRSNYIYEKSYIERVVDGDTLIAHVILADYGFHVYQMTIKTFRLAGIDTWEKYAVHGNQENKQKGLAAKARVKELIEHKWVTLVSHKDRQGSFKRWLADVYLPGDEPNSPKLKLSDILRTEGFEKVDENDGSPH